MTWILALDQGTTSSRAILFDREGAIHAVVTTRVSTDLSSVGMVEHDANEIWTSQIQVAQQVLATNGIRSTMCSHWNYESARDIDRLGSGHRRSIHHAIVWQDRRTAAMCDQLRQQGLADLIQAKTGLIVDAYFSVPRSVGCLITFLMLANAPNAENSPSAR